jgi:hypothetical protein
VPPLQRVFLGGQWPASSAGGFPDQPVELDTTFSWLSLRAIQAFSEPINRELLKRSHKDPRLFSAPTGLVFVMNGAFVEWFFIPIDFKESQWLQQNQKAPLK